MANEEINPWEWSKAFGFSQAVKLTGPGELLICSGQTVESGTALGVHRGMCRSRGVDPELQAIRREPMPPFEGPEKGRLGPHDMKTGEGGADLIGLAARAAVRAADACGEHPGAWTVGGPAHDVDHRTPAPDR